MPNDQSFRLSPLGLGICLLWVLSLIVRSGDYVSRLNRLEEYHCYLATYCYSILVPTAVTLLEQVNYSYPNGRQLSYNNNK